jgi:hypothetical protein
MSSLAIEKTQTIVQSKGFIASSMDGEKVMMSIESGKYYNLGRVGGRIWELVEAPVSVEGLIGGLMKEYEIDREQCEQQVMAFLKQMVEEQLVQVS